MPLSPLMIVTGAVFFVGAVIGGAATYQLLPASSAGRRRLFESTRPPGESTLPELMPLSERRSSPVWGPIGTILPRSKKDMARLAQEKS